MVATFAKNSSDGTKWIRIQDSSSIVGPIIESELPAIVMVLNGKIKLSIEKCCPLLFVGINPKIGLPLQNGCLNMTLEALNDLKFVMDERLYLLDWNFKPQADNTIRCQKHDKTYTCHFTEAQDKLVRVAFGKVYIFYPCFQNQSVDIMINLTLTGRNVYRKSALPTCQLLNTENQENICRKYYNESFWPNLFLHTHHKHASDWMAVLQIGINSRCHKYAEEILCRALFPQCQNLLCNSTCLEVVVCAETFLQQLISSNKDLSIPNYYTLLLNSLKTSYMEIINLLLNGLCNELPETGCFQTEPVTCAPPENTKNGFHNSTKSSYPVNSKVEYKCHSGYKLDGTGIVTCRYSGNWSRLPQCLLKDSDDDLIIICSVFGVLIYYNGHCDNMHCMVL